jgi:hypothetical protein
MFILLLAFTDCNWYAARVSVGSPPLRSDEDRPQRKERRHRFILSNTG